ncbi:hypothetical protein [Streptomyces sp. NPDC059349]
MTQPSAAKTAATVSMLQPASASAVNDFLAGVDCLAPSTGVE